MTKFFRDGGLNQSQNCNWLSDESRKSLSAVFRSTSASFSDLVKAAGLNPSTDFRFADISGVDLANSDVRGFDFTGSNLSETRWFGAIWDRTTILTDVNFAGAQGYLGGSASRQTQPSKQDRPDESMQNAPMAIATVDRLGKIVRSNLLFTRLFGSVAKTDSPDGGSILAVVAERDRAALEAAIRRAADKQGEIAPVDAVLADSVVRFARFYIASVEGDVGNREAAVVYGIETTEQRTLENMFTQSQKMELVGKLAGGVAYDINNVLGAIMLATDFLVNAHKPTDPSFQDIMQIRQNANRAAGLVRHLLAFSRKQTLRPQVLSLGEALSDLTMLLRRLIGENVSLSVQHGHDLWPVKVDIAQFEQVIVNLAVNARDAMPDGGKLTFLTSNVTDDGCARFNYKGMPLGEYVLIEVADSGTGIAPEIIDKIFDPFFTTKEVNKGTGLGLSTVYGIVKQTGGFIYLDSEVGKGTTFRIFLPRYIPSADELLASQSARISTPNPTSVATDKVQRTVLGLIGNGTVLLVGGEKGFRALNTRGLTSQGYTVLEAGDGFEGLDLISEHRGAIDLVVSEMFMPKMDGLTLLKEIRRRYPAIKMIFISGYAEEDIEVPKEVQFLAKPFTLKQLLAAVRTEIGR
jgi:two-component system, cell cycle sensor histidine kinase and response regulator CckA